MPTRFLPGRVPEGIDPPNTAEAGEVAIRRGKGETVLDRERRKVCIVHDVPACVGFVQETTEDVAMALAGDGDPRRFGIQPLLDLPPGFCRGLGPLEDARIGHETDERNERLPREADPPPL